MLPHSVITLMCLDGLFPWFLPPHWLFESVWLPLLLAEFPEQLVEEFDGDTQFRTEYVKVSNSISLSNCGSLYFHPSTAEEAYDVG